MARKNAATAKSIRKSNKSRAANKKADSKSNGTNDTNDTNDTENTDDVQLNKDIEVQDYNEVSDEKAASTLLKSDSRTAEEEYASDSVDIQLDSDQTVNDQKNGKKIEKQPVERPQLPAFRNFWFKASIGGADPSVLDEDLVSQLRQRCRSQEISFSHGALRFIRFKVPLTKSFYLNDDPIDRPSTFLMRNLTESTVNWSSMYSSVFCEATEAQLSAEYIYIASKYEIVDSPEVNGTWIRSEDALELAEEYGIINHIQALMTAKYESVPAHIKYARVRSASNESKERNRSLSSLSPSSSSEQISPAHFHREITNSHENWQDTKRKRSIDETDLLPINAEEADMIPIKRIRLLELEKEIIHERRKSRIFLSIALALGAATTIFSLKP